MNTELRTLEKIWRIWFYSVTLTISDVASERKDESQNNNNNNNKNKRLVGKMIPIRERMISRKKYLRKNLEKSVLEPVVFKVF